MTKNLKHLLRWGPTYRAAASISTRIPRTFTDLDLTAGTCVSRQAGASITSLASVGASGSIQTWLVMCAVVQIWKDQQKDLLTKQTDLRKRGITS